MVSSPSSPIYLEIGKTWKQKYYNQFSNNKKVQVKTIHPGSGVGKYTVYDVIWKTQLKR